MRKILLTAIVAMFAFNLFAQVKISARVGFSSAWVQSDSASIGNEKLSLTDLKGGFHFGLATQLKIKKFFIQPEVLFNSNTAEYHYTGAKEALKDRYNNLDVPVILGYKTGSFRVGAGPVGHVFVSRKSDLLKEDGFKETVKKMNFGYQAGIGLDLWKIQIDLKYEGNLDEFDSFIKFEDMDINLANSPDRMVVTLGYIF